LNTHRSLCPAANGFAQGFFIFYFKFNRSSRVVQK
jgi:hypothetical protein